MKQTMTEWLRERGYLENINVWMVAHEIARRLDALTEKVETNWTPTKIFEPKDEPGGVYVKVGMRVMYKSSGDCYTVAPYCEIPEWTSPGFIALYHGNGDIGLWPVKSLFYQGKQVLGYREEEK